jgi:CubicO group peptidase (beta-lactamase class C family)
VPSALPMQRVWDDVVALYGEGLHPAIGLCVIHRGEVVLDRTIGHLQAGGSEVVTPDTPFNLFSASKIVTAFVVHALIEDAERKNKRVSGERVRTCCTTRLRIRLRVGWW